MQKIAFMLCSILLAIIVFAASQTHAIIIGPSRLEVRLPPGEIAEADYYCQNDTEADIHVTVDAENWAKDAYDYTGLPIEDWIKFDCLEFDLKPKEIKKIKVTIKVPRKAKGELVAQIFFTAGALNPDVDTTGGVRTRLGAVLYVAIKDTEKANIIIDSIAASSIEKGKLKLDVQVTNTGNVHIRPGSGQVLIEDEKGLRVALLDLNTEVAVLPGKGYVYSAVWDTTALNSGKYRVSSVIKYGKMYVREKTAKLEKTLVVDKEGKVAVK